MAWTMAGPELINLFRTIVKLFRKKSEAITDFIFRWATALGNGKIERQRQTAIYRTLFRHGRKRDEENWTSADRHTAATHRRVTKRRIDGWTKNVHKWHGEYVIIICYFFFFFYSFFFLSIHFRFVASLRTIWTWTTTMCHNDGEREREKERKTGRSKENASAPPHNASQSIIASKTRCSISTYSYIQPTYICIAVLRGTVNSRASEFFTFT